jgi:methyltransferase (TIGR00027 family)
VTEWDIVSGVGLTALGAAAARAIESCRPDGLVNDPYAAAFVRAAHSPGPMAVTPAEADADPAFPWQSLATYVGVRSRFLDEYLEAAGLRQVTIIGAGLDARAFRLDWPPGTTLREIDAPRVLEFKDSVLRAQDALPRCDRRLVPSDLREDWPAALREVEFDPVRPTAWLTEGLMYYLDDETAESLLDRVHTLSAPGSRIAIEHHPDVSQIQNESFVREGNKRVDFDLPGLWASERFDPASWLSGRGWTVTAVTAADVAVGYGRPLDDGMPAMRGTTLIIAIRS